MGREKLHSRSAECGFNKPVSVQRPAQTPFLTDAVYWNEWPVEGDAPASDLSRGASLDIWGMPRCTIWRHGRPWKSATYTFSRSEYPVFWRKMAAGGAGEIPDFFIKKRAGPKPAQVPPPQRPARIVAVSILMVDRKKGRFLGRFCRKRGVPSKLFHISNTHFHCFLGLCLLQPVAPQIEAAG